MLRSGLTFRSFGRLVPGMFSVNLRTRCNNGIARSGSCRLYGSGQCRSGDSRAVSENEDIFRQSQDIHGLNSPGLELPGGFSFVDLNWEPWL
jgi:hypothetical protein